MNKRFIEDKSYLDEINNCINYIIKNLENINENKLYSIEEMKLINTILNDINNKNYEANEFIKSKIKSIPQNINNKIGIENENDIDIEQNIHIKNVCIYQKIYSLSIKIKNAIKSGFKRVVNYFKFLVNN